MKPLKLTLLFAICIVIFNCSNSDLDDNNGLTQQQFTGNFFPLNTGNTWDYDVSNTDNDTNQTVTSIDFIEVESQTNTGFTLSVNQNGIPNGIMSGILTSGTLSRTETTLSSNGTVALPIEGFDFQIELENALLYNTQANNGELLSTQSGVFTQDFEGYPITLNYTLTSTQLANLETLTEGNTTYNTVTSSNISLTLSVTTEVTFVTTQTFPIIDDTTPVLSINSYYAQDIGLIKAEASGGYTLNANTVSILEGIGVDLSQLPTSLSISNNQTLSNYSINQ